jgi:hypothetical protein
MFASYLVSSNELWFRIGTAQAPVILDVRRRDHGLIERGFMVYDALLAWLRHAAEERHNWPKTTQDRAA